MAAYERRSFSETAVDTTLNGGMTDSSPTFTLADSSGWPTGSNGDFMVRIEAEDIRCASRSGVTVTVQTGGRGVNGTAAAAHTSGVDIQHVFTATPDADEANYVVSQTVGQVAAAGDQLVGSALNALSKIPKGTSGQYWKQGASLPAWATLAAADVIDIDERIADTAGGMFTGNTETGITATYQDADNTVDLVVSIDSSFVTDFSEAVADTAGAMFTGNTETGIVATYQDSDNTVDLEVGVDGSTLEISSNQLRVKDSGIVAAKIADATITAAKLAAEAYTVYVPTFSASGGSFALGNGTVSARYNQVGKRVHAIGQLTLGSSTSFGTGSVEMTLPVTQQTLWAVNLGTCQASDASGNIQYVGYVYINTTPRFRFDQIGGELSGSSAVPFTWAATDTFTWVLDYEAS
jgi:hypothetical protein